MILWRKLRKQKPLKRIQDGNWDIAADCVSSVNQGLCWDAGDTLGWGKAQGRAETSALWTPSSWMASPCHDLLKEQLVLHTKPCHIGLWSCCSIGHGISDPWAPSQPCQGRTSPNSHSQTSTISARPSPSGLPSQRSTGIQDVQSAGPVPLRPAQARTISTLPGRAPMACQASNPQTFMIPTGACPSGLPG
jgi:hypothetical protein